MSDFDPRTEVTIKLNFPITVDGAEIGEVTMRRPKVGDSMAAKRIKGDDSDRGMWLLATLCGLAPEQLAGMDEVDLEALQAQHASFTGRQIET